MARAASDATPVMDPNTVTKPKAKRTAGQTAGHAATGPTAATAAPSHLTGPYGASFAGIAPDGSPTRGLTFERRWTRPGVHPYDEITWDRCRSPPRSTGGRTSCPLRRPRLSCHRRRLSCLHPRLRCPHPRLSCLRRRLSCLHPRPRCLRRRLSRIRSSGRKAHRSQILPGR